MSSGVRKARFTGEQVLTHDTSQYQFAMVEPETIEFRAGQFVSLACGPGQDGKLERRSYSIASPSHEKGAFGLVVKRMSGGLASKFFSGLEVGSEVEFTGPMGFFVLDLQHEGDVVFAATGTGIAPVIPMLHEIAARPTEARGRKVALYWGLRHLEDLFFQKELDAFSARMPGFSWQIHMTQPPPGWSGGQLGRITQAVLSSQQTLAQPTFYLVGNGEMVKELSRLLQERGVNRKRSIRTEIFFE